MSRIAPLLHAMADAAERNRIARLQDAYLRAEARAYENPDNAVLDAAADRAYGAYMIARFRAAGA